MSQQLLGLPRAILRHWQVGIIPFQGTDVLRTDPIAPGDPVALRLLKREELAVYGQADGLPHPLIVEGDVGLGIAGLCQPPGGREIGVPA
jgi:hypothetical protein